MQLCKEKPNLMHNLFLVYSVNLYMFWAYLGPSSGGTTVCIQQLELINLLGDRLLSWLNRIVCIWLYLRMMGLDMPETCRG